MGDLPVYFVECGHGGAFRHDVSIVWNLPVTRLQIKFFPLIPLFTENLWLPRPISG
jgi:hypothetical protein